MEIPATGAWLGLNFTGNQVTLMQAAASAFGSALRAQRVSEGKQPAAASHSAALFADGRGEGGSAPDAILTQLQQSCWSAELLLRDFHKTTVANDGACALRALRCALGEHSAAEGTAAADCVVFFRQCRGRLAREWDAAWESRREYCVNYFAVQEYAEDDSAPNTVFYSMDCLLGSVRSDPDGVVQQLLASGLAHADDESVQDALRFAHVDWPMRTLRVLIPADTDVPPESAACARSSRLRGKRKEVDADAVRVAQEEAEQRRQHADGEHRQRRQEVTLLQSAYRAYIQHPRAFLSAYDLHMLCSEMKLCLFIATEDNTGRVSWQKVGHDADNNAQKVFMVNVNGNHFDALHQK
jgi:hypothetical protein